MIRYKTELTYAIRHLEMIRNAIREVLGYIKMMILKTVRRNIETYGTELPCALWRHHIRNTLIEEHEDRYNTHK